MRDGAPCRWLADFRRLAEDAGALVIYDDSPHIVRDGLYTHSAGVAVIFLHPRP